MSGLMIYILVDTIGSLLVAGLLYSKRDIIKARLRAWLEVPTLPKEESFYEESELCDDDYYDYESAAAAAALATYHTDGGL